MSLIGIDVGTSAVKVAAYREDGVFLVSSRVPVTPSLPQAGWEEMAPPLIWEAVRHGLALIANSDELHKDPPSALAVSASGDEVFLVDNRGNPLSTCILSGDTRGSEIEAASLRKTSASQWYQSCGHLPERMDPVNRLQWWRANHPEKYHQALHFSGWHEFITYCLCGRWVTDPSLAAKWLVFDLSRQDWSSDRLKEFDLDQERLPTIQPWGTAIGEVKSSLAQELGLSNGCIVGVGAFDSICAALGSGVSRDGTGGVAFGSWQVVVSPATQIDISQELVSSGLSITPYPGLEPYAILAQSPNGTSVLNWLAEFSGESLLELEKNLQDSSFGPAPVIAIPHLSGAISPWFEARDSRGALLGLTLSTSRSDILKALMESIAYDLVLTMSLMEKTGSRVELLRASGGGSRSKWWMQLKADLTGLPVEVVDQDEPGTFGAALLAGAAAGFYDSAGQAAENFVRVSCRYSPNEERKKVYTNHQDLYQKMVLHLMALNRVLSQYTQ